MHGGKSLSGISHPRYRNGLYSKVMPKGLKRKFDRALSDPELLSLEGDIGLLTVRISELIEQLEQAEAPPWGQAVESLNDLSVALRSKDEAKVQEAFAAHSRIVREGADAGRVYDGTWRELREIVQDKTRTVRAEWSRITDLQGVLTAGQAWVFISAVLEAVKSNVADRGVLQRIQDSLNRLLASKEQPLIEGKVTNGNIL